MKRFTREILILFTILLADKSREICLFFFFLLLPRTSEAFCRPEINHYHCILQSFKKMLFLFLLLHKKTVIIIVSIFVTKIQFSLNRELKLSSLRSKWFNYQLTKYFIWTFICLLFLIDLWTKPIRHLKVFHISYYEVIFWKNIWGKYFRFVDNGVTLSAVFVILHLLT